MTPPQREVDDDDAPADGRIRAGDADRDRIAAALGAHYAAGRLDTAGLGERLETVYAARFRDEVAMVLVDLPPLAPPPQHRARGHRHGEATTPGTGWIPTAERFRDPTTERLMRVWRDPADGARHYVAETDH